MAADREDKPYRYAKLERQTGYYMSALVRRMSVVVDDHLTTQVIREISDELLLAAGHEGRNIEIRILSSPDVNAYVLPNGDIFICSGLLDAIENRDELAFVLGHELDHLLQHDMVTRLQEIRRAEDAQTVLIVALGAAGGIAGPLIGMQAAGGAYAAGASASTAMTSTIVSNVTSNAIVALGSVLGEAAKSAMVEGYSQKCELRADANGAKYAHAAGYDASAALTLFAKFDDLEKKAKQSNSPLVSSLVNAKPGSKRRAERMKAVLKKIDVNLLEGAK